MNVQYIVYGNGSVFTYPDQSKFVCQGAVLCLQDYLTAELTQSQQGNYTIATDQASGIQYIIWGNGTVTFMNGTYVCDGGSQGLIQFLSSQNININVIVPTKPNF